MIRTCRLSPGHDGRCSDVPFLESLRRTHPRIADKIIRDSFNTRGAAWGRNEEGVQARRNRQPRWTLVEVDQLYAHYQTYEECLKVAQELTLQVYEMPGAPECPQPDVNDLSRPPVAESYRCPICLNHIEIGEFELAQQSKAAVDTDHLNPSLHPLHAAGNVAFTHHECNTTKGERSLEEFLEWAAGVLERQRQFATPE